MTLTWDQDPQELYPALSIAPTVQRLIAERLQIPHE